MMNVGGNFYGFADDTAIVFWGDDYCALIDSVNKSLFAVKDWFDFNRMALNVDKTSVLRFRIGNKSLSHSIVESSSPLQEIVLPMMASVIVPRFLLRITVNILVC